jgi:hypothetical protein
MFIDYLNTDNLDDNGNIIAASLTTPIEFNINFPSENVGLNRSLDSRLRKIGFDIELEKTEQSKVRVFQIPKIMCKKLFDDTENEWVQKIYSIVLDEFKVSFDFSTIL